MSMITQKGVALSKSVRNHIEKWEEEQCSENISLSTVVAVVFEGACGHCCLPLTEGMQQVQNRNNSKKKKNYNKNSNRNNSKKENTAF